MKKTAIFFLLALFPLMSYANCTLILPSAGDTFSGVVSGSESLSGTNTYTGTTTINSNATPLLSDSGSVILGSNTLLLSNATATFSAFSGIISGTGGLVLNGTNSYSDGTLSNVQDTTFPETVSDS
ncbi:MAG: hypothetical protein WCH10_02470 [bacterium]